MLPQSLQCAGGKRILRSFLDSQMISRLTALTRESDPDRFAKCEEEVKAFMFHMYVRHYARTNAGFSTALASIPSLKVWDDHDIIDGWGDYSSELQSSEIMQLIYRTAREMYLLFQHQTYEVQIDAQVGDSSSATPKKFKFEDDQNLFGKARNEELKYQGGAAHFLHTMGPTAVLGIDCRSERKYFEDYPGANTVFTDDSLQMILEKLRGVERGGAKNQHLLVMLGSPLGTPSAAGAERAVSCVPVVAAPIALPLAFFNWCVFDSACAACSKCGVCEACVSKRHLNWQAPEMVLTCCGAVARTPWSFYPGLVDDFQDGWHNPGVHRQRDDLVRGLQQFAETSRIRVTFLSGDVHFGASSVIQRNTYNRECFSHRVFTDPTDAVCCVLTSVMYALGCDCCNCYCCRPCAPVLKGIYTKESDHMLMHQFVSSPMANQPTMPPFGLASHPAPPLTTDNLLENTGGVRSTLSVFSRDGTLLPSSYADARYIDAVIVSKAFAVLCSVKTKDDGQTCNGNEMYAARLCIPFGFVNGDGVCVA